MTIDEAAKLLAKEYVEALPRREQALSIHLFAIKHAQEIEGMSLKDLAIRAQISPTYATELRKGISLARYVVLKA